jgi:hypothetical protein
MHNFTDILPAHVVHFLRGRITAEYAMVSAAGVPIDTPTFVKFGGWFRAGNAG